MFNWFRTSSKSAGRTRSAPAPARPLPVAACDPEAFARLPASAHQLSPQAQRILLALPPSIDLGRSCEQFPQAVEKLLQQWRDPREFRRTLDAMVMDSRGGRKGFPFDVVREFSTLREYYDRYVNPVKLNAWETVDAR